MLIYDRKKCINEIQKMFIFSRHEPIWMIGQILTSDKKEWNILTCHGIIRMNELLKRRGIWVPYFATCVLCKNKENG